MARTPATRQHVLRAVVTSTLTSDVPIHSGLDSRDDGGEVDMSTEVTEHDSMHEDDEIVSEAENEGAFNSRLSKVYGDRNDNATGTNTTPSLFDTLINAKGVAVKMMLDEWKQEWSQNEQVASLQLVNLLLHSSNVPPAERWEEEDPAAVISALQDHITNPLRTYAMGQKRFRYAFEDFWMKWSMEVMPGQVDNATLEHGLMSWIVCMSSSAFRPLRVAATTAALRILSGCAKSITQLGKQKKSKKQGSSNDDNVAFLGRIIQVLFDGVFVQRYRDIDATIRERCLTELLVWMEACPGTFLDNTYLRYLGWSLSDKQVRVRRLSAASIGQLLKPVAWRKSVKSFTDRFTSRLVEMACKDVDEAVRHSSMTVVAALHEYKMLSGQGEDFVSDLIKRKDWQTLQIASKLFVEGLSGRVSTEAPFRAGVMIMELIHTVKQFVSESDTLKALERIIEATGGHLTASLGNFLDVIALVNTRLATLTDRSSGRKVVARVYGKECDDSTASKLLGNPADHHLLLCCYRSLARVTERTEHVAVMVTSIARHMQTRHGCDEAIKMLHLIPESEALPLLEDLLLTNYARCTPELVTELWSGMQHREQVSASQGRMMTRMIDVLAFEDEDKEGHLPSVHLLTELTKQVRPPAELSSKLTGIIDKLFVHLQIESRESDGVLVCWSALLQCFFQDLLWRLKDACREGDPEFILLDKRDRLVRWCDLSRCVQEYVDDPREGNRSRAFLTASILVDLACLSSNAIPSLHGWRTDIDCQAVFDLLGASPEGTEEERIKLITMACKVVVKLGQETGIRHVLRAYRPSADALIRTALEHTKGRVNLVDCAMSALEGNVSVEALLGVLKLAQPFLSDHVSIAKMMVSNAVLAEDDQIIAKCINASLLSKFSDEDRHALLVFLEDADNLGNFKGGPALANLIKQLGRKRVTRRAARTGGDAISSAADVQSVDHPTSEHPHAEYNVIMDRHTQTALPTLHDHTNNKHPLSDPFVQAEHQAFVSVSPFIQEDAANPFADENPFYDTKYSDGRTSQVESEEERATSTVSNNDIQHARDPENRPESDNRRTFRNRARINYTEFDDHLTKRNAGKPRKGTNELVAMESPAKKPKRQHIRL